MEDEVASYFQSIEDGDYDADSEASDVSDEVESEMLTNVKNYSLTQSYEHNFIIKPMTLVY